jgi:hypothetical protein
MMGREEEEEEDGVLDCLLTVFLSTLDAEMLEVFEEWNLVRVDLRVLN